MISAIEAPPSPPVFWDDPDMPHAQTRSCPLCGDPKNPTDEHILPTWLLRDFDPQGPFTIEKNGVPLTRSDGSPMSSPEAERVKLRGVCVPCQTWLNQQFEQPAKEHVRGMLAGAPVTAPDVDKISRWAIKTLLLHGHPDAEFTQTNHRTDIQRGTFAASPKLIAEFRATGRVPADLSLWLAASSDTATVIGVEHHAELTMPNVVRKTDGTEVRISTSLLGFGTSLPDDHHVLFHLVYHPMMDPVNPWESDGHVVRLWPTPPATLDVTALPTLDQQSRRNLSHWLIGGRVFISRSGERWSPGESLPGQAEASEGSTPPTGRFRTCRLLKRLTIRGRRRG